MYPFLNIGPFALPTKPFTYIVGAFLTLVVLEQAAVHLKLDKEKVYSAGVTGLAAGFIGARLTFVFLNWSAFATNLGGIVWPLTSGYSPWGGVLFGSLGAFFYLRAKAIGYADFLDAAAPALMVGLAAASLGDWLGGPGYGVASSVFGGRHPVQVYEIGAAGLALLIWWPATRRRPHAGYPALVTAAVYAAGLILVAPFRANPWLVEGFYMTQLAGLVAMLLSLGALAYFARPA